MVALCRFFVLSLVLALHPLPAYAQTAYATASDVVYSPLNSDQYMQAWNVIVRAPQINIFLSFTISNFGPGSHNNGVAVIVSGHDENFVETGEYDSNSLQAVPGKFGFTMNYMSSLKLEGGAYVARVYLPDCDIRIRIRPLRPGLRLSEGKIPVKDDRFVRADIPVTAGRAEAVVIRGGKSRSYTGEGGVEHILTDVSPHSYAKRFLLLRSFGTGDGLFIGGFIANDDYRDDLRLMETMNGKIVATGHLETAREFGTSLEPLRDASLPSELDLTFATPGGQCSASISLTNFTGGIDLLGNISPLLRWVLHVFFTKPYIVHYDSDVTLTCPSGSRVYHAIPITYYLLND